MTDTGRDRRVYLKISCYYWTLNAVPMMPTTEISESFLHYSHKKDFNIGSTKINLSQYFPFIFWMMWNADVIIIIYYLFSYKNNIVMYYGTTLLFYLQIHVKYNRQFISVLFYNSGNLCVFCFV